MYIFIPRSKFHQISTNISFLQRTFGDLQTGNTGEKQTIFRDEDILNVSRQLCESFVLSAQVGLSPFFDGRYRVVKYEDVSLWMWRK